MIGKLQGIVDYIGEGYIILMTGGVGYKVFTPEYFTQKSTVSLWIETVVREDSIRLFGFSSIAAQNLFNQLTAVSGVGPKLALAIMGAIKTDTLMSAIATGDAKTITAAPGVGKKVAEKIIVELKSKIGGASFNMAGDAAASGTLPDLLAALESLGYRRLDIVDMAQKLVSENPDADVSKLVPMALKQISGNK
ncbi:MAG: Holliday junction branch migration protein RuvA [Proteobacteria bacterium]|uniref:Holliday junction branch migration complex subunit RuvA n=1 Tax=Candidatus Enterousia excrementavium TaxID=2840789 RepID=A0A940DGP9_9PROT|nr:Holliday junction branch migration protein RuvA [Candidatus Enterousia excrementavium]